MSTVITAEVRPRLSRLLDFVRDTHPPKTYVVFASLWSLSLLAVFASLTGPVHLGLAAAVVPVTFFFVLLFLRAVDEIKDLDYDRRYKTDRPLVRGDVSVAEVAGLAAVVAVAVIALNAVALSAKVAGFVTFNLAYGVFLLALERISRSFREGILLNLAMTFPVSAALNVYTYLFLLDAGHAPHPSAAAPVIAAYVAAFLHFEFGRKLKWPKLAEPGENGYAMVLGGRGAVLATLGLGVTAVALAVSAHVAAGAGSLAWLPCLALVPSCLGLSRFYQERDEHRDLKPFFALSLVLFFATNLLIALSR